MNYTLITGASGGIGLEIARECAAQGHSLILTARDRDKLAALREELIGKYKDIKVKILALDLTRPEQVQALCDHTEARGWVVENLVNNAGFANWGDFLDIDWRRQSELLRLNIMTLTRLSYFYGKRMRWRAHGHILNLSSVASFSAGPHMSLYYASKGFILSLSEAMAEELKGTGVTVTALCPGPTATGFEEAAGMTRSKMFSFVKPATAQSVAKHGYKAMMSGKVVELHGPQARLMNVGARLAPRALARKFAHRVNVGK
ncbi:MAG: SDR family NAD(P)-dependent oxidoreductase [Fastidiosipilaceae bacterium]|jgi:short-subunit dehydrogenase